MATLHQDSQLPGQVQESDPEGVLVVFESWDTGKYGLPEFHRNLFKDVCSRSGHNLKAFATILGDSVDEDQKADAGEVGITLIAGKRSELIDPRDDPVDKRWLIYHKSYYTALKDLKNINYVLGYAPFTAAAAADIRRSLFPQAKLYQINAVNPRYCADLTSEEQENEMLKIAEEADAVVSVGPSTYDYFENKYRAINGVSHIELLPRAGEYFYKHKFSMPENIRQLEILSFGGICARSVKAISDYGQLAVSLDEIAPSLRQFGIRDINWNVIGIPKKDDGYVRNYLEEKMKGKLVKMRAFPECSPTDLVRRLKQCHLCLLPQSNINYGFMGLESIAVGVPTFLNGKSELSYFIDGHFKDNGSTFLVEHNEQWKEKIQKMVNKPSSDSVCKQAIRLKKDFIECKDVRQSYDRFAAMFKRCSKPSEDLDVSVGLAVEIWKIYTRGIREEINKLSDGELVFESGMRPGKKKELIQACDTLRQMLKDNAAKSYTTSQNGTVTAENVVAMKLF
ncbi:uncharacterized protein [Ptychodera flava]|uniref:uncharacterized protein n=1 Tax=Ptychodera flava TaxID=63121 RepID=UPI003969DD6D